MQSIVHVIAMLSLGAGIKSWFVSCIEDLCRFSGRGVTIQEKRIVIYCDIFQYIAILCFPYIFSQI